MRRFVFLFALVAAISLRLYAQSANPAASCIECHSKQTPNIVSDWKLSKHSQMEVTCVACHGDQHQSASDVSKVKIPTPETCAQCHSTQVEQYKRGKHSKAWAAMLAMPTIHWQPMAMIEGQKGCGGCHKIGEKPVEEIAKQRGILPAGAAAPTCQTCHMQNGDHGVRTAWGFLAVRLPLPEDKQWAADRATVLQALGVLDPDGKPTALVATVQAADLARLTQEDWQGERDKMLKTCNQCHSGNF